MLSPFAPFTPPRQVSPWLRGFLLADSDGQKQALGGRKQILGTAPAKIKTPAQGLFLPI